MAKVTIIILLNAVITFSGLLLYDYFILTPKFSSYMPLTADIDKIFRVSEQKVRSNEISLDVYRDRVRLAERLIGEYGMVVNKNVRVGDELRPLVFGGNDITDEILERMEAVK